MTNQGADVVGPGYHVSSRGVFRVTGEDAEDFIERTVTNEVEGIDEMTWIPSLLLDPKGRTTDHLDILHLTNDSYLVSSNRYRDTAENWRNNIFIEDIEIEAKEDTVTWIVGDDLSEAKEALGVPETIDVDGVTESSIDDSEIYIYGETVNESEWLRVISERSALQRLESILGAQGIREMDLDTLKAWRILHRSPSLEHELGGRIPLGAGGHRFISFDKGCFVGQEIVARIEQRGGGATEELRALSLDAEVEEDAKIFFDDEEVGVVTSFAQHSGMDWIALGVVDVDAGDELTVGSERVKAVPLEVVVG